MSYSKKWILLFHLVRLTTSIYKRYFLSTEKWIVHILYNIFASLCANKLFAIIYSGRKRRSIYYKIPARFVIDPLTGQTKSVTPLNQPFSNFVRTLKTGNSFKYGKNQNLKLLNKVNQFTSNSNHKGFAVRKPFSSRRSSGNSCCHILMCNSYFTIAHSDIFHLKMGCEL